MQPVTEGSLEDLCRVCPDEDPLSVLHLAEHLCSNRRYASAVSLAFSILTLFPVPESQAESAASPWCRTIHCALLSASQGGRVWTPEAQQALMYIHANINVIPVGLARLVLRVHTARLSVLPVYPDAMARGLAVRLREVGHSVDAEVVHFVHQWIEMPLIKRKMIAGSGDRMRWLSLSAGLPLCLRAVAQARLAAIIPVPIPPPTAVTSHPVPPAAALAYCSAALEAAFLRLSPSLLSHVRMLDSLSSRPACLSLIPEIVTPLAMSGALLSGHVGECPALLSAWGMDTFPLSLLSSVPPYTLRAPTDVLKMCRDNVAVCPSAALAIATVVVAGAKPPQHLSRQWSSTVLKSARLMALGRAYPAPLSLKIAIGTIGLGSVSVPDTMGTAEGVRSVREMLPADPCSPYLQAALRVAKGEALTEGGGEGAADENADVPNSAPIPLEKLYSGPFGASCLALGALSMLHVSEYSKAAGLVQRCLAAPPTPHCPAPNSGDLEYALCCCEALTNRLDNARQAMTRCLAADPKHGGGLRAKQLLEDEDTAQNGAHELKLGAVAALSVAGYGVKGDVNGPDLSVVGDICRLVSKGEGHKGTPHVPRSQRANRPGAGGGGRGENDYPAYQGENQALDSSLVSGGSWGDSSLVSRVDSDRVGSRARHQASGAPRGPPPIGRPGRPTRRYDDASPDMRGSALVDPQGRRGTPGIPLPTPSGSIRTGQLDSQLDDVARRRRERERQAELATSPSEFGASSIAAGVSNMGSSFGGMSMSFSELGPSPAAGGRANGVTPVRTPMEQGVNGVTPTGPSFGNHSVLGSGMAVDPGSVPRPGRQGGAAFATPVDATPGGAFVSPLMDESPVMRSPPILRRGLQRPPPPSSVAARQGPNGGSVISAFSPFSAFDAGSSFQ
ncbi:hypothetical protein KIPB_002347 [Kipferlia bialata]|uniref:Uncharacterized protein n=1 Tax=Kipferlia bialata TaxID=797122 RepID=A0A9K3CSB7_9EUKA|nr:hypothetical protein KIPB_002347 [Kipferlia bialata]|eukprot:g2347.t1